MVASLPLVAGLIFAVSGMYQKWWRYLGRRDYETVLDLLEPGEFSGTTVDLEASVWRELREETGLTAADVVAEPDPDSVLT